MKTRPLAFLVVAILVLVPAAMAQLTPGSDVVPIQTSWPSPIVADINGDGLDDLIQVNMVQLNLGNGTFGPPRTVVPAGVANILGALDFNGDGRADLIAGETVPMVPGAQWNHSGPIFDLYRGNGDGTFTHLGVLPMDGWPYIVDFNGDGKDDLVMVANTIDDQMMHASFYQSNGDGTFTLTDKKDFPRGMPFGGPQAGFGGHLAVGDLNHDGHPDIVVRGRNSLVFFFGRGDGTFDETTRFYPEATGVGGLDIADVDGDGNPDLVFRDYDKTLHVMYGDGTGHFPRTATYVIPDHELSDDVSNFAIGKFTTSHPEIAVTTNRGEVLILSAEGGQIQEKARVPIGLHWPTMTFGGRFFSSDKRDLFYTGFSKDTRLGDYEGFAVQGVHAANAPSLRVRRLRAGGQPPAGAQIAPPTKYFRVWITDRCTNYEEAWTFASDGFFLDDVAPKAGRKVSAAFIDGTYYFLITPDGSDPKIPQVSGSFTQDGALFPAQATGINSCGQFSNYQIRVTY